MRNLYTIDSISYNIQDIWKLAGFCEKTGVD